MHNRSKAEAVAARQKNGAENKARIEKYKNAQRRALQIVRSERLFREIIDSEDENAADADADAGGAKVADIDDKQAITVLTAMITVNPDFYSLWNARKTIVARQAAGVMDAEYNARKNRSVCEVNENHAFENDEVKQLSIQTVHEHAEMEQSHSLELLVEQELSLTQQALTKQPKCYSAWFHRLWAIDMLLTTPFPSRDFDMKRKYWPILKDHDDEYTIYISKYIKKCRSELELCSRMAKLDNRNFHCWNYRRSIVARLDAVDSNKTDSCIRYFPPLQFLPEKMLISAEIIEMEFNYTTVCINDDISNFSAWHYRTVLIECIQKWQMRNCGTDASNTKGVVNCNIVTLIASEFKLIEPALFMDPADQSPWLYFRWLLGKSFFLCNIKPSFDIPIGIMYDAHGTCDFAIMRVDFLANLLRSELSTLEQLLELEPNGKFVKMTHAIVQQALAQISLSENISIASSSVENNIAADN